MSYSRWGDSRWYTYWSSSSKKDDEGMFEVASICSLSYQEIKDDIDGAILKVFNKMKNDFAESNKVEMLHLVDEGSNKDDLRRYMFTSLSAPTKEELDELKGYMSEFLLDIEQERKENEKQD